MFAYLSISSEPNASFFFTQETLDSVDTDKDGYVSVDEYLSMSRRIYCM